MTRRSRSLVPIFVVGAVLTGCSSSKSSVDTKTSRPVVASDAAPATTDAEEPPASTEAPPEEPAEPAAKDLSAFEVDFPVDEGVTIGTLENGLTYYVRSNDNPGGKVQLRLVVNAGSAQEADDQAGVAHFLEHMLFNGTEKYPENELVDVLQSFGSEFGADVNAYTSYDETVYELSLPTADSGVVAQGFDILHEWLTAATLLPDLVIGERGVVLDEWRQGENSFNGRVSNTIEEMIFAPTAYGGRSPIGNEAAINAMTPELLRRFYDDWYRPDNAAIVVVGDIDAGEMEGLISTTFAEATSRGSNPPREEIVLEQFTDFGVGSLVDAEASDPMIEITLPVPASTDERVIATRAELITAMTFDIIATRLTDDETLGETPFAEASVSSNDWVRAIDAPSLFVTANPEMAAESLDALAVEMERVYRYGVTEAEVARSMAQFEAAERDEYEARESRQDVDFVDSYVDHFLSGEPIPNADDGHQIALDIFASIDPSDIQDALIERAGMAAPQVLLVAPESDTAGLPSRDDVIALFEGLGDRDIEPREAAAAVDGVLMAAIPEPVEEVSSEQVDGDPGWYVEPTLLTFPNGAKVYLNPTVIAEGIVSFQATSPGGLSLVADADVANASAMTAVVAGSGLGELNAVELSQVLAGTSVAVNPYLDSISDSIGASGATDDLETMMQVAHLMITDPHFDEDALADFVTEVTPYVEDPTLDPDFAAQIKLNDLRYGPEPRMQLLPTAADLAALDLAQMDRIWDERFGNASDWVFALVGDFDIDQATDLMRRYVGNLPGDGTVETAGDVEIDPPATIVTGEVIGGTGDKAAITVQFNGSTEGGRREQALADITGEILTNRLTENVREALGASYSPSAFTSLYDAPDLLVETTISVTGSATDLDRLSAVVQENVNALRTAGTGGGEFEAAVEAMVQRYSYINNDVIALQLLKDGLKPDFDLMRELNVFEEFETITPDDVNAFMQRVLPADRYIEVRLRP